jgi:glucose/arabinose dehydrogenase
MKPFKNFICKSSRAARITVLLTGTSLIFSGSTKKSTMDETGLQVPKGFTIERVVSPDLLSYPMFAVFDAKGRMFVFESTGPNMVTTQQMLNNPVYHVRLLEDTDGDGIFDKSKIFADKLPFPKGGTFYNGSLYISAAPNLLRLTDKDNDGVADEREVVITGWTLHHNGATLGGPFFGPDGWLYLTDAHRGFEIKTKEGQVLKGKGADPTVPDWNGCREVVLTTRSKSPSCPPARPSEP